jgi:hypothetical protein
MLGRNFVRNSINIGVGLAMLAGVACGQPTDKTSEATTEETPTAEVILEDQIEQFYDPMSEIPIGFATIEMQESTNEFDQQTIFQKVEEGLSQYYATLKNAGFPAQPDGISELTITASDIEYVTLPVVSKRIDLEQKIETAENTIEDLKGYLSEANLKFPEVYFVVSYDFSKSDIEDQKKSDQIDKIDVYLIAHSQKAFGIEGTAKYGDLVLPITMNINIRSAGGENVANTHLFGKVGELDVEYLYGNIIWSLEGPPQTILETPAMEILHRATALYHEQHAKQLVQKAKTDEEAIDGIDRADSLNEYVVHGIGRSWFERFNQSKGLGYNMENLKQQGKVSSWWLDPNVDAMEKYVMKVGPAAVIGMYRTNPENLIADAGLNMR